MSSISPLTNLLLSNTVHIKITGSLGHYQVSLEDETTQYTCSLTKVLSTFKELQHLETEVNPSIQSNLKAIQTACEQQAKVTSTVADILTICDDIIMKESRQQAQEINESQSPLLEHLEPLERIDEQDLLRIAPLLVHIDLTGLEEYIEQSIEGGMDSFLRNCHQMTYLKVSSPNLQSITSPSLTKLVCEDCTSLTSLDTPQLTELHHQGCSSLHSINAPKLEDKVRKIQTAFRANRAKLRLRAKEKAYKSIPLYNEVIDKIDQGESRGLADALKNLTDPQFLSAFRYLVSRRDEKGNTIINKSVQKVFEKYLIDQFSIKGSGFEEYDTFDVKGISELVEYYKLVCPELDRCDITTLFAPPEEWGEISIGTGEKFFLADDSSDGITIAHVQGLYVNYDDKTAYFFDSLGGSKQSIKIIREKLGPDFTIVTGTTKIQHDSHNCMVFAITCMANIAKSAASFSARLQAVANSSESKEILQQATIPEAIMMTQSLSLLNKYDQWISLVQESHPDRDLEGLFENFNQNFLEPLTAKVAELQKNEEELRSVGEEFDKVIEEQKKEIFKLRGIRKKLLESDSLKEQIQGIENTILAIRENIRQLIADNPHKKIKDKLSKIQFHASEVKGFRDYWLQNLHEDRDLLTKVSNQAERLREIDGAIRLDDPSGTEQNFLMERVRLRTLYFMATRCSFA
jgi:hypothetical protein